MKTLVTSLILSAAVVGFAPSALGAPPVNDAGHVHHVITGNGGCIQIDAVRFLAQPRGLHQGASASGTHGPGHGGCP